MAALIATERWPAGLLINGAPVQAGDVLQPDDVGNVRIAKSRGWIEEQADAPPQPQPEQPQPEQPQPKAKAPRRRR